MSNRKIDAIDAFVEYILFLFFALFTTLYTTDMCGKRLFNVKYKVTKKKLFFLKMFKK